MDMPLTDAPVAAVHERLGAVAAARPQLAGFGGARRREPRRRPADC